MRFGGWWKRRVGDVSSLIPFPSLPRSRFRFPQIRNSSPPIPVNPTKLSPQPGEVARSDRGEVLALWDRVLEQVAFAAPDLTGQQAVAVAGALAALPFSHGPRVEATLAALQRVLRYSSHAVVPAAPPPAPPAAARPGAAAGAARRRRGAAGGAAGGALSSIDGGAGPESQQQQQQQQRSGPAPPPSDMHGGSYARLLYVLGRINSSARPWRMSVRLPPSYIRGLLLGSYAALAPAAPPGAVAASAGSSAAGGLRPKDYAHMLYGLACLRVAPPVPWLYAFYVTSARAVPAMNDTELSMLMYGACRIAPPAGAPAAVVAAAKPPAPWIEACLDQFARRFAAPRPAAAHAGRGGRGSAGSGSGSGGEEEQHQVQHQHHQQDGEEEEEQDAGREAGRKEEYVGMDGAALAGVVLALGRLKYKPRRVWLDAHLAASGAALAAGRLSPTEISHLVREGGKSPMFVRKGQRAVCSLGKQSVVVLSKRYTSLVRHRART